MAKAFQIYSTKLNYAEASTPEKFQNIPNPAEIYLHTCEISTSKYFWEVKAP